MKKSNGRKIDRTGASRTVDRKLARPYRHLPLNGAMMPLVFITFAALLRVCLSQCLLIHLVFIISFRRVASSHRLLIAISFRPSSFQVAEKER